MQFTADESRQQARIVLQSHLSLTQATVIKPINALVLLFLCISQAIVIKIEASPDHSIQPKRTEFSTSVCRKDVRYGEAELKRMLADRPTMSKYVKPGDEVWNWCINQQHIL